jgi:GTPase SAR1 family protein
MNQNLLDEIVLFSDIQSDLRDLKIETGLQQDISNFINHLIDLMYTENDLMNGYGSISVAVIGDFSAGKSSMINSLVGETICPVRDNPTTSAVSYFTWGREIKFYERNANQKKEITSEQYEQGVQHEYQSNQSPNQNSIEYVVEYPYDTLRDITIIDTPGFGNVEYPNDTDITKQHTVNADVILYVLDINKGAIGEDSLNILKQIKTDHNKHSNSNHWYLILNKADTKAPTSRKTIKDTLFEKYKDLFKNAYCYSSKWALDMSTKSDHFWLNYLKNTIENCSWGEEEKSKELRFSLTLGDRNAVLIKNLNDHHNDDDQDKFFVKAGNDDHMINVSEFQDLLILIAKNKREFVKANAINTLFNLKQKGEKLIELLTKIEIDTNIKALAQNTSDDAIQKALQNEMIIWCQRNETLLLSKMIQNEIPITLRELSQTEESYVFNPYFGLIIEDSSYFINTLIKTQTLLKQKLKEVLLAKDAYQEDHFDAVFKNIDEDLANYLNILVKNYFRDSKLKTQPQWVDRDQIIKSHNTAIPQKIFLQTFVNQSEAIANRHTVLRAIFERFFSYYYQVCESFAINLINTYSSRLLGSNKSLHETKTEDLKNIQSKLEKLKTTNQNLQLNC